MSKIFPRFQARVFSRIFGSPEVIPGLMTGDTFLVLLGAWEEASGVSTLQVSGKETPLHTHTATVYAPDHENIYRIFEDGEVVWREGRVARNISKQSHSLGTSPWFGGTIAGDSTVTINADGSATFATNTGGRAYLTQYLTTIIGHVYTIRVKASNIIGTPGADNITVTFPTFWSKISINGIHSFTFTATATNHYIRVGVGVIGADSSINHSITFHEVQMEDVTGRGSTITSEYIETGATTVQRVFAYANGNTIDAAHLVTEAKGATLSPAPSIVAQGPLTNMVLQSRDVDNLWIIEGGAKIRFDTIGLDGTASTGVRCVDNNTGATCLTHYATTNVPLQNQTVTHRVFIAKSDDGLTFPEFDLSTFGGDPCAVQVNKQTGAWATRTPLSTQQTITVIDGGWHWVLIAEIKHGLVPAGTLGINFYPAVAATIGAAHDVTTVGEVEVLQYECYFNASLKQVTQALPIFTGSAPVSTDPIETTYNTTNLINASGALYIEVYPQDGLIAGSFLSWFTDTFTLTDQSVNSTAAGGTTGQVNKVGCVWNAGDALMAICINGTWSTNATYGGTINLGDLDMFKSVAGAGYFKNLRTFKYKTLNGLKEAINLEMV